MSDLDEANLPSKVLQAQSHLNRTGVYFGFARVVAQDLDDPDLIKGDDAFANLHQSAESSHNGQRGNLDLNSYDDPGDDEWEVDEDEIILSASPTGSAPGQVGTGEGNLLEPGRTKPRQSSKSSARSFRGLSSALERVSSANSARSIKEPTTATQTPSRSGDVVPEFSANTQVDSENGTDSVVGQAGVLPEDKNVSKTGSLGRRRKLHVPISTADQQVFPMVMSIGWNPFYKNTMKTAEVHIMHAFEADFYGLEMRVVVLGYIRPEYNYVSKEALIKDIDIDKRVAHNSLARNLYQDYARDPFLSAPS